MFGLTAADRLTVASMGKRGAHHELRLMIRERALVIGAAITLLVAVAAFAGPYLSPYDPNVIVSQDRLLSPSMDHPLGTDKFGRDVATRVLYGARLSLLISVGAIALSALAGVPLGMIGGYLGHKTDAATLIVLDTMFAVPPLVLALFLIAIRGPSASSVLIAIGVVSIPSFARQIRGPSIAAKESDYVLAARASGAGHARIIARHIFPNVLSSVIVRISLSIPGAVLAESGLSFLGLGVPPPTSSWGQMLSDSRPFLDAKPWLMLGPGAALFMFVMGLNLFGDGLRDYLDPRLRTRAL